MIRIGNILRKVTAHPRPRLHHHKAVVGGQGRGASVLIMLVLWLGATSAALAQGANQSLPMKVHEIYDLKIPLPVDWKISKNLSDSTQTKSGSVLAVDYSKRLTYPRNIEIKVIPESVDANRYYMQKMQSSLRQKFSASYRSLSGYETVHAEITEVSNVKSMLLFSHFNLAGSDMTHVHLIVPRSDYYYLITYSDFRNRLKSSSDESFEMFWSMAGELSVADQTIFSAVVEQKSAFALIVLATTALLVLLAGLFVFLKSLARAQPKPAVLDLDMDEVESFKVPAPRPAKPPARRRRKKPARPRPPAKPSVARPSSALARNVETLQGAHEVEEEDDILDFKEFSMTQDLGAASGTEELDGTLINQLDFIETKLDKPESPNQPKKKTKQAS